MATVTSRSQQVQTPVTPHEIRDVQQTRCCIVGGGPAGAVLALLLARNDVPVILLEAHRDFDRDFRGDTIHPAVMEIMEELGLAERLLQLPHTEIHSVTVQTAQGPIKPVDFHRLKTKFPYITMLPQVDFLKFITAEAQHCPSFQLIMGARVEELIEGDGIVRGVRYQSADGWHEVRALLTVAADGRFSRIRRLAGCEPITTSPPMDVLWYRLPRRPNDPEEAIGRFKEGRMQILLNRFDCWQAAYIIPKGSYQKLRAAGLEALRRSIADMVPEFADRVAHLQDWNQIALLSVASDRLPRWYKSGLLLIGDAAHVMSPIGGVGINTAIQDAVVTANVLSGPLKRGRLRLRHLRAVQRQREWPTRIMQWLQAQAQRRIVVNALNPNTTRNVPQILRNLVRIPILRNVPAWIMGYGIWPVHVKH